jgi:hypothetical protein
MMMITMSRRRKRRRKLRMRMTMASDIRENLHTSVKFTHKNVSTV